MRARAAEHGRRGGKVGSREGKRRGGLLAWHTRSPEEQAAILARLRAAGGRQANTSVKARRAQAARAKKRWEARAPMSAEQATFLADIGVLDRVALAGAPPPGMEPGAPRPEDYPDTHTWMIASNEWHATKAWRERQRNGDKG